MMIERTAIVESFWAIDASGFRGVSVCIEVKYRVLVNETIGGCGVEHPPR